MNNVVNAAMLSVSVSLPPHTPTSLGFTGSRQLLFPQTTLNTVHTVPFSTGDTQSLVGTSGSRLFSF